MDEKILLPLYSEYEGSIYFFVYQAILNRESHARMVIFKRLQHQLTVRNFKMPTFKIKAGILKNGSAFLRASLFIAYMLYSGIGNAVVPPVVEQPQLKAKLIKTNITDTSTQGKNFQSQAAKSSALIKNRKSKIAEPQKPRIIEARVTEPEMRSKIVQHVREEMKSFLSPQDLKYLTVEIAKIPGMPYILPVAAYPIKITMTSPLDRFYTDRSIIQVEMQGNGEKPVVMGVPVRLHIQKPVWIVKNIVNARASLNLSDFDLEVRDVSPNYRYVVGQDRPLDDYIARVTLQPGEMLDNRKIIIPPDVSYNDTVRIVIADENGMTIIVPGIALADGRVGETIRVRQSVFQKKSYNAKVIDKNRVLVEM